MGILLMGTQLCYLKKANNMFKSHICSEHSETLFIYILLCYLTVFSDCDDTSNIKNCEFCVTDEWKLNFDAMKEAIDILKSNTSYIVANFTDIQGISFIIKTSNLTNFTIHVFV